MGGRWSPWSLVWSCREYCTGPSAAWDHAKSEPGGWVTELIERKIKHAPQSQKPMLKIPDCSRYKQAPAVQVQNGPNLPFFPYRTHIFSLYLVFDELKIVQKLWSQQVGEYFSCGLMEILCAVWWLSAYIHIKRSFLYVFGSWPLRRGILFCLCFPCNAFISTDKGFCSWQNPSEPFRAWSCLELCLTLATHWAGCHWGNCGKGHSATCSWTALCPQGL